MVVLHIAKIKNEHTTGVAVAVPQHVQAQAGKTQTALLNLFGVEIDHVEQQFIWDGTCSLEQLPSPFSKPDIAVFHNTYHFEYIRIQRMLKKSGIPYVIIPHGTLVKKAQHSKWFKKTAANLLFFNRFFKGAAAIQFLSEQEMLQSKFTEKGFIGSNGVAIQAKVAMPKERDNIRMVYIGRPEVHIKGLDMLIESVSRNRQLFAEKNVHVDLYGPDRFGRHAQVLELIRQYEVADYITLHGAVIGKEKEEILLDADIFIQTSRSEGMPMGILEAMSYGLPCLITEGTCLGGIVRQYDAGWVADTDTDSIAKAMETAVTQKNSWCRKAVQARKLITENYTWEKNAETALAMYRKLIGK